MDVIALVGPSGTGKSHRALKIAHEFAIDLIIDDGLVIRGSKILEGRSAKREHTRVAAIRRAMFEETAHAENARAAILAASPRRVLVLGTSRGMISRIVDALCLPRPGRYIEIDDVASPDDIRRAMRLRRDEGKHVIPAPTFEVRRTFSGYLVDPLRLKLFRRGQKARLPAVDVEKSVVHPTFSSLGKYSIADTVIIAIVRHTAIEIDGVARAGRVGVDWGDEGVVLRLELVLHHGYRLQNVMAAVQSAVKRDVEYMTALNVLEVEVTAYRLLVEADGQGDSTR